MATSDEDEYSQSLLTGQTKPPRDRQVLTIVVTSDGAKVKEALIGQKEDKFNVVYFIMLLQGMGTLLPWNFFITAHEYFSAKLKGTDYQHDFENYFALAAFGPNLIAFFLNTLFKHRVPLKVRMLLPLSVMTLLFVITAAFVWIDTHNWKGSFFAITLITIGLINVFCAVLQGGLFGLSGMMPQRYTQAVMTGQGVGGIFACMADIGSKIGTSDAIDSAFWYFITAVVVLVACMIAYLALYRIEFSRHFLLEHKEPVDITGDTRVHTDGYDYSDKPKLNRAVEKEVNIKMTKATPPFLLIFRQIWRLALAVYLVFMVTLAVFPAVISGVKSKHRKDGSLWTGKFFTPVVCFLLFNVGDFTGRFIAGFVQKPGKEGYWLLAACASRFIFLPLFALCNYQPRKTQSSVFFAEDYWPILFNIFFAVSNGYLGSLCMMYGPRLAESKYAETAGTMMAFFLALGLGTGGATSFAITKLV